MWKYDKFERIKEVKDWIGIAHLIAGIFIFVFTQQMMQWSLTLITLFKSYWIIFFIVYDFMPDKYLVKDEVEKDIPLVHLIGVMTGCFMIGGLFAWITHKFSQKDHQKIGLFFFAEFCSILMIEAPFRSQNLDATRYSHLGIDLVVVIITAFVWRNYIYDENQKNKEPEEEEDLPWY